MQTILPTSEEHFSGVLFSRHYFKDTLPKSSYWEEIEEESKEAFKEIKRIYEESVEVLSDMSEPTLRDDFIKPILKKLGHIVDVETPLLSIVGIEKKPDYAFFENKEAKQKAIKLGRARKTDEYFDLSIGIGEAKEWNKNLDKGGRENPSVKINRYLRYTRVKWGILTNGRQWRIYCREAPFSRNVYYEINLPELLRHPSHFRYFYGFFSHKAFSLERGKECFLDKLYNQSIRFARELEEDLKNNVYKSLELWMKGFLKHEANDLNEEDLMEIHEKSLILLYRLLFIFYAEARNLLPREDPVYQDYSLHEMIDKIAKEMGNGKFYPPKAINYWEKLNRLFKLVNQGSEEVLGVKGLVPPYNGGLFDPKKHKFLEENVVPDDYLTEAIDFLARRKEEIGKVFVDYSDLSIRHLGSIYEGLLEYKPRIANEDLKVVREKGKEIYKPVKNDKKADVHKGELYLATDKGERKVTGSYYTPEYIVKYIVENALGPIIKEKIEESRENDGKERDAILSIGVLDPAMGSGHFLVEAIDFLTRHLIEAVNHDIEKGLLAEEEYTAEWGRREIVSHCIYGVDNNPMAVELAKLSLWLATISKDKPLSFLDHRLKCGNSLIGEKLENLPILPGKEKKKKGKVYKAFIDKLIEQTKKIEEISDNTLEEIKQKEEMFQQLKNSDAYKRIKILADARTATYFGVEISGDPHKTYMNFVNEAYYGSPSKWKEKSSRGWVKKGVNKAKEKRFFHWQLEFPEVFYEAGKEKENPGFDAVIGNPPWGGGLFRDDTDFLDRFFPMVNDYESFQYFTILSLGVLKHRGLHGFIVPNTYFLNVLATNFRSYILSKGSCIRVRDYTKIPVFEDPNVRCIVYIYRKGSFTEQMPVELYKKKVIRVVNVPRDAVKNGQDWTSFLRRSSELDRVISNIDRLSITLSFITKSKQGFIPYRFTTLAKRFGEKRAKEIRDNREWHSNQKKIEHHKKEIQGVDVGRYQLNWSGMWIKYGPWISTYVDPWYFSQPRLLIREITTSPPYCLHAVYTEEEYYHNPSILNAVIDDPSYNMLYVLSVINSKLISQWFTIKGPKADKGLFPKIIVDDIRSLPIRRISFTTPKEEREKLVENLKSKYYVALFDEILSTVEECLPKDEKGDSIPEKEKSDVVHDFLAFLAEEMIETKKEKQDLKNKFWMDLEGVVDEATFEKLQKGKQGRSLFKKESCQKYVKEGSYTTHNLDEALTWSKSAFKDFVKMLAGKVHNLSEIVEIYNRYSDGASDLSKKIEWADWLIDQIVYKLYGITDEEIKIVEKFVRK